MNAAQRYFRDLAGFTTLQADEQDELARRFARDRDPQDARALVLANLRLVTMIARELGGHRSDFMDLVQEGNAGLMVAIERFDPSRGSKLSSYAAIWIRSYVMRHLMETTNLVRSTTTRAGRRDFFARTLPSDVRLDAPVSRVEGDVRTKLDYLPSSEESRPDTIVEEREALSYVRDAVTRFSTTLTKRERVIFESRLLNENPRPLRKVGAKLALSGERVRQLEQDMLVRLRGLVDDSQTEHTAIAA
jgi:RNA polymerase sigma-32 factor